ncbi:MAG: hypothetical protein JXB04_06390 [Kiritimatiellae bacterium]|nr:hypothetical protein [Kiritimatiellia bacterium]
MRPVYVLLVGCFAVGLVMPGRGEDEPSYELQNGGFEAPSILAGADPTSQPDKWFYFSSAENSEAGITDRKKRGGEQAFYFKGQKVRDAFHGIAQKVAIEPGTRAELSVYAVSDSREPVSGEAHGVVSLEWQDATGKEITRTLGTSWNFTLSPVRWESFRVVENAPEGAACCVAVITFFSRDCDGRGICFIDDAQLTLGEVE